MAQAGKRSFLVECYVPGLEADEVAETAARALAATAELRAEGIDVQYLNAIHVPGDEVVFHLFEAADEADVREASERSTVQWERIVESVAVAGHAAGAAERSSTANGGAEA